MKTIVFECLNVSHRWSVAWYAFRGYAISYLQADLGESPPRWFLKWTGSRRLQAVSLKKPVRVRFNPAGDLACEVTEHLYEQIGAFRHPLVRQMEALFKDERIHLAFKKYLNALLEQHFYYVLLGKELQDSLGVTDFSFVPARIKGGQLPPVTGGNMPPWGLPFLRGLPLNGPVPPLPMKIPWGSQFKGRLLELWGNLGTVLGTLLLLGWKFLSSPRKSGEREPVPFAVSLIVPDREFANEIRGFDYLLDGKRIRKDNTLFVPIARLSPAQRKQVFARGLRLAEAPSRLSGEVLAQVFQASGTLLRHLCFSPWWITRVAAYLVRDYGIWSGFQTRYRVDQFVSYNEYSFRHIGRNILLKQGGATTWYYTDTVNTFSAFRVEGDRDWSFRQAIWSYLFYDYYLTWSERFARFVRRHPHAIGRFIPVGCLWSEHVRLLQEGTLSSSLRERLIASGRYAPDRMKLVALFDSSYVDGSITSYRDGIAFAEGIERLLRKLPDIFVVWKEKKARPATQQRGMDVQALIAAYLKLEQHPRCCFVGHEVCASEAIALADLVISFPFTSTTVEALAARTKALYYDPDGKYSSAYYARLPGVVAQGFEQLRDRVESLLYQTRREDYSAYLDREIQGEIDPYLDGKALTRFRNLLCEGTQARNRDGSAIGVPEPAIHG